MVKKMLAAMAALVIMGGMCSCKSSIPYNIKFIVEVSSTYINENQSDNPMDSRFEEAYDQTYQILCHRLELLGAEFESKKLPETHQYEFLINAVEEGTDISSLRNALRGTGKLEFWLVYKGRDAVRYLYEIDDYISRNKECEGARLFDLLTVINTTESPVAATAKLSDTVMINKMLKRAAENEVYSWREIKFMWAAKPDTGNFISLYAIEVSTRDGSPLLDGSCITDASYDEGYYGNEVNMSMSSNGASKWKRITGENVGRCIAITVDGYVYSAPCVNGEIAAGRSQITGDFTVEEARGLATVFQTGFLPLPCRIVFEDSDHK